MIKPTTNTKKQQIWLNQQQTLKTTNIIEPTTNPKKMINQQETLYNINNNKRNNKQQLCSHKNFICWINNQKDLILSIRQQNIWISAFWSDKQFKKSSMVV